MKKIYVLTLESSLRGKITHEVISAYDLDEAKHLMLDKLNSGGNPHWKMEDLEDKLITWLEIPIWISKQGTYFPKPVTHVISGDGEVTKSIEILKDKKDIS